MRTRKSPIALSLVKNSKFAILAAVEIHNKPIFAYRYELTTILVINAWELLLKAYIYKHLRTVKLFKKDGRTKEFDECIACVASNLGKDFEATKESLENLYKYRNKVAHFYCENLDALLYSLLRANIGFYVDFLQKHFGIDLSRETDLILLPLGFIKPFSPIDFVSNTSSITGASKEVQEFIQSIVDSSKRLDAMGVEDSIFVEFRMSLINEKRVKNADIIAAINNSQEQPVTIGVENYDKGFRLSDDRNAKEIRLSEDDLYKTVFTEDYLDIIQEAKIRFKDFKQGKKFNSIMRELKQNQTLHRVRSLDPENPKSAKKDWYSKKIYDELAKYYDATNGNYPNRLENTPSSPDA